MSLSPDRPESYIERDAHGMVRLAASKDRETGRLVFPPIPTQAPSSSRYERVLLSPRATLYSFAELYPSPKSGRPSFTVIYADFADGCRVAGVLEAGTLPKIGMALRVDDVDAGEDVIKFRDAEGDRD